MNKKISIYNLSEQKKISFEFNKKRWEHICNKYGTISNESFVPKDLYSFGKYINEILKRGTDMKFSEIDKISSENVKYIECIAMSKNQNKPKQFYTVSISCEKINDVVKFDLLKTSDGEKIPISIEAVKEISDKICKNPDQTYYKFSDNAVVFHMKNIDDTKNVISKFISDVYDIVPESKKFPNFIDKSLLDILKENNMKKIEIIKECVHLSDSLPDSTFSSQKKSMNKIFDKLVEV